MIYITFRLTLVTFVVLISTSSCTWDRNLIEDNATQNKFPEFSWDKIPQYMHIYKATAYEDKELEYLAQFPLITFEKAQGTKEGSVQEGTLKAARAVKKLNPKAKILYYKNIVIDWGGSSASKNLESLDAINERLDFVTAIFLVIAEKYSYFLPHDKYVVRKNRVGKQINRTWMKILPIFKKRLGAPKGPAKKDGYIYTREFEHCSVWLDIENQKAELKWK